MSAAQRLAEALLDEARGRALLAEVLDEALEQRELWTFGRKNNYAGTLTGHMWRALTEKLASQTGDQT